MRYSIISLAACILIALLSVPAIASKRVALVIGNSAYEYAGKLKNARNDSEDMKVALEQLGFHVIHDVDLERPEFFDKLDEFAEALKGAEAGLFYFAGHGLQVSGKNYLMPTDAELSRGHRSLANEMVELELIQKMLEAETKTSILLLDACRNNPLARNLKKGLGTRSAEVGTGLAKVEAGYGTLIGFSTQPGGVAADKGSNGRNSPYTAALKKHILTPGEDLTSILINVRRDVVEATDREQVPWEHHNLLNKVYLGGKVEIPAGGGGDAGLRVQLKKQINSSNSVTELDAFKRLHPSFGPMIEVRKKELALLKEREEEEARKRDPALSVNAGTGESFKDRLANGEPCDFCPEMVVVPAGYFLMGSPEGEEGRGDDEGPQHEVTFAKPFAVGKFEVTVEQFASFLGASTYEVGEDCFQWTGREWEKKVDRFRNPGFRQTGKHPEVCVNNYDAVEFSRWLSKQTGKPYRLLTEAEWEYSARAGTSGRYFFGEGDLSQYAWWVGNSRGETKPVGKKKPNTFGIFDMHGNVAEWVSNCYSYGYGGSSIDCSRMTVRGGSWSDGANNLRSAKRNGIPTFNRNSDLGFRVARDLRP